MNSKRKSPALFILLTVLALGLFPICRGGEPQVASISVPNLHMTGKERLVGYEIHITSGRVAELPKVPIGWSLCIDNNASWNTSIKASSTVAAAAVEPAFFQDFLVVEKNESLGVPFDMRGDVVVTENFTTERRIRVGLNDFAMKAIPEH